MVRAAVAAIAAAEAKVAAQDEVEIRAREAHAALESRHATLRELKDTYEGYDASVRWLVAGASRPARILGTVGDVLHASGEWLVALEAALGEAVQFVVAERTEAALEALQALEASGEGRATFISLDRLSRARVAPIPDEVSGAPGVLGPLLDHVRFEPGFVALASFLLSGVVVVESIEAGLKLNERFAGERLHFVTRRGERVVGPGIFQGGSGSTRAGSVLRREDELTVLAAEIETLRQGALPEPSRFPSRRARRVPPRSRSRKRPRVSSRRRSRRFAPTSRGAPSSTSAATPWCRPARRSRRRSPRSRRTSSARSRRRSRRSWRSRARTKSAGGWTPF